ncbi:Hypp3188 [Branchiostoma lanceolatum]|uniref:Hypp3188 protein n=1 Tax=Branchiostoma lanceolatum TaxID=7740 RepID=A0A8J9ZXQ2_BRALA|nr:Hypp3188 [Branchiostoma lanceolatum]
MKDEQSHYAEYAEDQPSGKSSKSDSRETILISSGRLQWRSPKKRRRCDVSGKPRGAETPSGSHGSQSGGLTADNFKRHGMQVFDIQEYGTEHYKTSLLGLQEDI